MAKSKKLNSKPKKATSNKAPKARAGPALDEGARKYAALIADPCNAPLVNPVYAGGEGGYLTRTEVIFTQGGVAGAFMWTPGAVGSTSSEVIGFNAAGGGTATAVTTYGSSPGKTFLNNTASVCRPVAACLKLTFLGSESSRSGRVSFGHASGGLMDIGETPTSDQIAQTLSYTSRTPAEGVELIWKPNDADQMFTDPNATTLASEKDRKASLVVAWDGLPAINGWCFHLTCVWEWQPRQAQGISNPTLNKSVSNNSLDHVVNALIRGGFQFANAVGIGMGSGAVNSAAGIMGRAYGLMSSRVTQVPRLSF
jgi:hypothetical protein